MRILWTRRAERDLELIAEFVARDDPAAALRIKFAVVHQIKLLRDFPSIGRRGRVRGTRELVIKRLPYVAIYNFDRKTVRILRILHGAMQWPPLS